MMCMYVLLHGYSFSFGDTIPALAAMPYAKALRAALELPGGSQLVDVDTGKVLNVSRLSDRVVLVSHDAANGC